MRALVSIAPGGPETLVMRDLPDPVAGPGEVRVAVAACGINYPDVLMIQDKYQFTIPRPFAPGIEICGSIDAIGPGVEGLDIGTRVLAQIPCGGLAERAVVAADRLLVVPAGVSAEHAAGFLLFFWAPATLNTLKTLRDRPKDGPQRASATINCHTFQSAVHPQPLVIPQ